MMRACLLLLAVAVLATGCASGPSPRDGERRPLIVEAFTNHTLQPTAGRIVADLFAAQASARGWSVQSAETAEGAYRLTGAVTEYDYREAGSRGPALGFTAHLRDPANGEIVWSGSFTGSARGWTGHALNGIAMETVDRALTGMAQRLEAGADDGG